MASQLKLGAPVTEHQMAAARLVAKTVVGRTTWTNKANTAWVEARWPIRHEMASVDLKLVATVNTRAPEKYSASMLWNEVRVAGVCVLTPHVNKHTDQNSFGWEVHEHVWTDECNATWCRAVARPAGSVRDAVEQLCDSFNVKFVVDWTDPPLAYQIGMVKL